MLEIKNSKWAMILQKGASDLDIFLFFIDKALTLIIDITSQFIKDHSKAVTVEPYPSFPSFSY